MLKSEFIDFLDQLENIEKHLKILYLQNKELKKEKYGNISQ